MSEDFMKSVRNFEEIEKGSQNSYQSVWMAHWNRTGIDATGPRFSASDLIASHISGPSKPFEEFNPLTTVEIRNHNVTEETSKNGQRYPPSPVNNGSVQTGQSLLILQKDTEMRGSRSSQSSSILKEAKEMRGMQPSKQLVGTVQIHEGRRRATSCCIPSSSAAATEISRGQSKSQELMENTKTNAFFGGENSYVESRPEHNIFGSASGIILYRSGSGKKNFEFERSAKSSYKGSHFVRANDQLPSSDISKSETESYHRRIGSTNVLSTTSIKTYTTSLKSSTPYRQLDSLNDPAISANRPSVSRDNHLPLQNFPGFKLHQFSTYGNFSGLTKLEKFHDSSSPLLRHGQQGVNIRTLGSSTDSGGDKKHDESKDSEGNLKNTSSAETDVMDMGAFTEKCHTPGVNQFSLMKALNTNTMQFSCNRSGTEVGNSLNKKELPDTNLELSAANNGIEGAVPSSSKTQSLDMDMLVSYPAQTNNSVSGPSPNILLKTDPTERWAKRLKSCAVDTQAVGTQSFDLEDVLRKKMTRQSDMLTSELGKGNHIEILAVADKSKAIQRNNDTSSKDATNRGKHLLLSQSWIQRWLRNQACSPEKQSEALVLCEPHSSKLVLGDHQKKQFPSMAAMALMGKAMNGFQPCELQNRGPFVVWN